MALREVDRVFNKNKSRQKRGSEIQIGGIIYSI